MQIQVDAWRAPFYQDVLFPSAFLLWEKSVFLDHKRLQSEIYVWIGPMTATKSRVKIEEVSMEFKTILLLFCSLSTWVLQSLCWQREVCQMPTSQLYLWRCISELQVWKELLSLWERPSIHGLHQWVASLCSGLSFLLLHLYLNSLLASSHVPLQSAILCLPCLLTCWTGYQKLVGWVYVFLFSFSPSCSLSDSRRRARIFKLLPIFSALDPELHPEGTVCL